MAVGLHLPVSLRGLQALADLKCGGRFGFTRADLSNPMLLVRWFLPRPFSAHTTPGWTLPFAPPLRLFAPAHTQYIHFRHFRHTHPHPPGEDTAGCTQTGRLQITPNTTPGKPPAVLTATRAGLNVGGIGFRYHVIRCWGCLQMRGTQHRTSGASETENPKTTL